jgi:catechol 2,3-dioxygenase-like lactoylglutathione lyase family enzyme
MHHVQLAMPRGEEAAARAFFAGVLGLAEIEKPPALAARGGVWFELGDRGQQLHIGVTAEHAPARKAHPGFEVDSGEALDRLAAALEAAGHEVRWDQELPGVRRFYVDDPWGNRLELLARALSA